MLKSKLLGDFDHGFGTRFDPDSQHEMASLRQVHSANCLVANHPGLAGEADALITNQPGLAVSVRTADCFPVLLLDPTHKVVAAVHAGWRGTAARIVMSAIGQMTSAFDTNPAEILAAIGPGIGECCYQVGEEVARQFGRSSAGRIDLAEANLAQLIEAGVPASHIDVLGFCTFCDAERFHSFRRDKDRAGRMISYIRLPNPAIAGWASWVPRRTHSCVPPIIVTTLLQRRRESLDAARMSACATSHINQEML